MPRTNVEALLIHQPKQPLPQPTKQPPPEAFEPAAKPRAGLGAARTPKAKGKRPARRASAAAEGSEGDPGDHARAPITQAHDRAFARIRPEIEALHRDEVRRITVHVPSASVLALGALPKMMALREAMRTTFTAPPLAALDKLEDYALAAAHAHARALPYGEGETNLRALVNEAAPLRGRLLLNAQSLATFGLLDAKSVVAIRHGTGHLDTAQDLSSLGLLYLDAWPAIASKTPFQRSDAERAIELGGLLLKALGRRDQGTDGSGEPDEAEEQLGKAYELFRRAYEACRHAIVYLRRDEGDADDIAPPLARSRRRGRSAPADEPEGGDEPAADGPDGTTGLERSSPG